MYTPKSTIKTFYELIKNGWEPSFAEIKNKFFPQVNGYDPMRNTQLARLLIMRIRRMLKKENLFFYSVTEMNDKGIMQEHFKLLEGAGERMGVTGALWKLTKGFATSTKNLLEDTCNTYPHLERNALAEVKAAFNLIHQLSTSAALQLETVIKNIEEKSEKKGGE